MSDVFINQIHIQKACGSDNYCHSNLQMKARFTDENQRPHPTWVPFQSAFMHPAVLMLSLKVMRFRCSEHRRVHVNNQIKLTGIVQTHKQLRLLSLISLTWAKSTRANIYKCDMLWLQQLLTNLAIVFRTHENTSPCGIFFVLLLHFGCSSAPAALGKGEGARPGGWRGGVTLNESPAHHRAKTEK